MRQVEMLLEPDRLSGQSQPSPRRILRGELRRPLERELVRDRDTKLRIYPGLAPMLAMPFIFLVRDFSGGAAGGFGVAFAGGYLGLIPLLGLGLLQYSQQWQASDLFRAAPLSGPAPLCHGARRAVLCLLTLPVLVLFGLIAWAVQPDSSTLALLLPGVIALPVYAMIPCLGGKGVPLSIPTEEAKSAGRGMRPSSMSRAARL